MKLIWKILIPILVIVIVFDAILVMQNISGRTKLLLEKNALELEKEYQTINAFFKLQEDKLLALAIQMANNDEVQKAFANGDRELLFNLVKPSFHGLIKHELITGFAFFKPLAQTYLIPHKLKNFGKDVSGFRKTIVTVNQEQKHVCGIEAGRESLPIRAVVPVFYSGKHIGALDFLKQMDQKLLTELNKLVQGDLAIYVPVEKKKLMKEVEFVGNAPEGFLTYSSSSGNYLPINPQLHKTVVSSRQKTIIEFSHAGHNYDVLIAPIFDFKDDVTAVIEMYRSKDAFLAEIVKSRNLGIFYGVVVLIISTLLIWLIVVQFITKPISHINSVADAISLGDFTVKLDVSTKDEIGDLAHAIERMRTSLKGAIERLRKRR